MKFSACCVLLVLVIASPVFAWGSKEHVQITRIAANRLIADSSTPPAMKAWLQSLYPTPTDMAAEKEFFMTARLGATPVGLTGMSQAVIDPDLHANSDPQDRKIEPFGVRERILHFIDMEYLLPGDTKKVYKHDLSNKPKIADFPRDIKDPRYQQAGMLPFAIEHYYKQLVQAIKDNRLTETEDNNNAVYYAGYLAHYIEDNTQPQHSTEDYMSQSYFAQKKRGLNVHSDFEWKMNDDEKNPFKELRTEFWPLFEKHLESYKDPIETTDLFTATLEVSSKSYDCLPLIGLAAMKATKQQGTPEQPKGNSQPLDVEEFFRYKGNVNGEAITVMEMKARQQAWAVKRVEKVWKQAWVEAGK